MQAYISTGFAAKFNGRYAWKEVSTWDAKDEHYLFQLANYHKLNRSYKKAVKTYSQLIKMNSPLTYTAFLFIAQCLQKYRPGKQIKKTVLALTNKMKPPLYIGYQIRQALNDTSYLKKAKSAVAPKNLWVTLMPYFVSLGYDTQEEKDSGTLIGLYSNVTYKKISLELFFEQTNIGWKNKSTTDLAQTNFGGVATWFSGEYAFKLGINNLSTTEVNTDAGRAIILGVKRSKYYNWDLGIDVFNTTYPDYQNVGVGIWQFTPYWGKWFRSFYFKLIGYLVIPSISDSNASGDDRLGKMNKSVEASLSYYYKSINITFLYWTGDQFWVIKNGGFILVNATDIYSSGFKVELGKQLNTNIGVKISYGQSSYEVSSNAKDSTSSTITALMSITF